MRTLIIPCAGKSSRFANMRPKYLLTYPDGSLMIQKAISGLNLELFDRIIITVVAKHCEKYESEIILKQAFNISTNSKIELCILPDFTRSQSETVYQTIKKMNVEGAIIIKDSDNYLSVSSIPEGNFIVGLDLKTFPKNINNLSSKSFLIVNEQDLIIDIIEKEITSSILGVGMYGFSNALLFSSTYRNMLQEKKEECGEIFLSHVISHMIGTGKIFFKYLHACDYEDWGTSEDWMATQQLHQTYFIDLDGVILKNRGRYGSNNWNNSNVILEENMAVVKQLFDKGAQIVITTSRDASYRDFILKLFEDNGINLHAIITGCNHAKRTIINDYAPSNSYPSCSAISIPRDGNLKDFINQ